MTEVSTGRWGTAISTFIVAILLLQTYASLFSERSWAHKKWRRATSWPFVSYPMYSGAKYEGWSIDVRGTVYVTGADGVRHPIRPEDRGMSFWVYRASFVEPLRRNDPRRLAPFVAEYCDGSGADVVLFELEDDGYRLTRAGAEVVEPSIIATRALSCAAGDMS